MKRINVGVIAIGSALVLFASSATADQFTCTVCTPPTGTLGYTWFTTRSTSSFICTFGSQSITQSYGGTALVGFRRDGSIGAIRFVSGSVTRQIFVAQDSNCQVNF